jgi:hypothetical protein
MPGDAGAKRRREDGSPAAAGNAADDATAGAASAAAPAAKRAARTSHPSLADCAAAPSTGAELAGLSGVDAAARGAQARREVAAVRSAYAFLTAPPGETGDDHRALSDAYAALLSAASGAQRSAARIIAAQPRTHAHARWLFSPRAHVRSVALAALMCDVCAAALLAGCASARRLAASFVPQFAARVPGSLDAAVAALASLADACASAPPRSLSAAARDAALAGLACLAATSAAAHGGDAKASKAAAAALLRRATCDDAASAPASEALAAAFRDAPQGVLAALMMAFVARDESGGAGARAGARAWAARALRGDVVAGVMRGAPHTAAWFRAAARAFRAGAPPALAAEVRA